MGTFRPLHVYFTLWSVRTIDQAVLGFRSRSLINKLQRLLKNSSAMPYNPPSSLPNPVVFVHVRFGQSTFGTMPTTTLELCLSRCLLRPPHAWFFQYRAQFPLRYQSRMTTAHSLIHAAKFTLDPRCPIVASVSLAFSSVPFTWLLVVLLA